MGKTGSVQVLKSVPTSQKIYARARPMLAPINVAASSPAIVSTETPWKSMAVRRTSFVRKEHVRPGSFAMRPSVAKKMMEGPLD